MKTLLSTATYKLVISDGDGHTTVVPLLRDEVTIGREKGNTIRLTERNVSRAHARLLRRNGSFVVQDLGSYNGVTVNGQRIDDATALASGDKLGIGDYGLTFQCDAVATASTMPPPPLKSEPPPRLVLLGQPAPGAEFTLSKPAMRIGRDERLDIWINHKSISHEHAEIQIVDGRATLFDLQSANGMRVNGIRVSRAVLESGDVVQFGEVRFRFFPAEGAHSLVPPVEDPSAAAPSSRAVAKPLVALAIVGGLVVLGAGAVFATLRSGTSNQAAPLPSGAALVGEQATPTAGTTPTSGQEPRREREARTAATAQPQEWERELARARRALARGRFDRAYAIADDLPSDSVLRRTPEFREIRYRYVQSHIVDGERALEDGDTARALAEAKLVLQVPGTTTKQRQDARRLARKAKASQGRRIVD